MKAFQALGLAPFSVGRSFMWKKNRVFEMVSIFIFLIIAAIFSISMIINVMLIKHSEPNLRIAIYIFSNVMVCIHTLTILCENFLKRQHHIKLLNLFNKIEQILKYHRVIQINTVSLEYNLKFVIYYWAVQTMGMSALVIAILLEENNEELYLFTTYAIPFLLSKLSYVYIIIFVVVLQEIMNTLLNFIISLNDTNGAWIEENPIILNVSSSTCRRSQGNKLNFNTVLFLKRSCVLIWRASVLLNYIFYYSLPIGFFNEFSVLVFNCYFIIQFIQSTFETDLLSYFYIATLTLFNLANIFLIALAYENAVKSVIYKYFFFK